jgi:hypothetical protein
MKWRENIAAWQALPLEKRFEIRWKRIPRNVAISMAFENEPVNQQWLESLHRQTTPGASRRLSGSFIIPS